MDTVKRAAPLRVSLLGMDERSKNLMHVFFKVQFRKEFVPVDGELADITVFDLDGYRGRTQWDEFRQRHPDRPTIAISLQPADDLGCLFVRKPLKVKALKVACIRLLQGIDAKVSVPSGPVATLVSAVPIEPPAVVDPRPVSHPRAIASPTRAEAVALVEPTEIDPDLNTHGAAGRLAANDPKNHVGSRSDIDPTNADAVASIQYDPDAFFQKVLKDAFELAKEKNGHVAVKTPYGMIVVLPGGRHAQVRLESGRHLRILSCLPAKRNGVGILSLDGEPAHVEGSDFPVFSTEALLWESALNSARGRIPKGTPLDVPVCLLVWPNMTRLALFPHALRIAALWANQPYSLLDTAKVLQIPQRYVFAFYSAANALGVAIPTRKSSDLLFESPALAHHRRRGLFGRILDRLRHAEL
jgi:hypothetical protein